MNPPASSRIRRAFTLIELPVVITVIAVLIGVFLPAVQRTREDNNQTAVEENMRQIFAAERTYFRSNAAYTNSLGTLGLNASFPNNSANGYIFALTVTSTSGFTASAAPANPGLNGRLDFRVDQTGRIIPTPDPDALAVHEQVTEDIATSASQVMAQAIADTDTAQTDMPAIRNVLTFQFAVPLAFKQFTSGDRITVSDILGYSGLGAAEMSPLLTAIGNDFKFGSADENISNIALTSAQTLASSDPVWIRGTLGIYDGVSTETVTSGTTAGFAALTGGLLLGRAQLVIHQPDMLASVAPYVAQSGTGSAWGGPISFSTLYGDHINGITVGEMLPAVQAGAASHPPQYNGIIIALDDTGVLTAGAGFGTVTLDFDTALGDPFTGLIHIFPPQ